MSSKYIIGNDTSVLAAALILDAALPGWHNRIDLSKFDINHNSNCVLGQLFGSYGKGFYELRILGIFVGHGSPFSSEYRSVRGPQWVEEIKQRQGLNLRK